MGSGKTAQRFKSECVIDAAAALLALKLPVRAAADVASSHTAELKKAHTAVPGLGRVTFDYFLMLLGNRGVKADTMTTRFVNSALAEAGIAAVKPKAAGELVRAAYADTSRGADLTHYEHAIWLTESERAR